MIRSLKIGALAWAGLAWAGLAWGQQALNPAGPKEESRVIVVQESGKAPQRCRVLNVTKQPDGSTAYQVQCLETGEMMTLMGSAPPPPGSPKGMQGTPTTIYRWGSSPLVPPSEPVPSESHPPARPTLLGRLVGQGVSSTPVFSTSAKPPSAPTLLAPRPEVSPPVVGEPAPVVYTPPAPAAPEKAAPAVRTPPTRVRGGEQPFARSSAMTGGWRSSWGKAEPARKPVEVPVTSAARPAIPVAKPIARDPLESVDTLHPTLAGPPAQPPARKSALRPMTDPRKHIPTPTPALSPISASSPPAVKPEPSPGDAGVMEDVVVVSRSRATPVRPTAASTPAEDVGPGGLISQFRRLRRQHTGPAAVKRPKVSQDSGWEEEPTPAPEAPAVMGSEVMAGPVEAPGLPAGMGSVLAAQDVPPDPAPRPTVPSIPADEGNAFGTPHPAHGQPVQRHTTAYRPHGMMPPGGYPAPGMSLPIPPPYLPMPQAPRMDVGIGSGAENAFTPEGTSRPIPADFGASRAAPNGFSDPAEQMRGAPGMGGYRPRMAPPMPQGMPAAVPYVPTVMPSAPVQPQRTSMWPGAATPDQLVAMLAHELSPTLRAWAADQLARLDGRSRPDLVEGLRQAAAKDPAPMVRVACVEALSSLGVRSASVLRTVQGLQEDADPGVRQAAATALEGMTR